MPKKIAILTGGGDAPGLNAVIRASVKSALHLGWEIYGVKDGFAGFLKPDSIQKLTSKEISGILTLGGTILGTTNRGNPFSFPVKTKKGLQARDLSDRVVRKIKKMRLDALIAIGGDGTLSIAQKLAQKGVKVVGVPKTIDNDVVGTVITFGFDTAVSIATEAMDRLHSTAQSHQRVLVVEVMGRYAGWIALHSGISGGADVILIPEIPFDWEAVCRKVEERYRSGPNFCIIVAAEGAAPLGGSYAVQEGKQVGKEHVRLGGIAELAASEIQKRTGREARSLVLGHLQRGGSPTTFDRLLSTRFGVAAVHLIEQGRSGRMVALDPPKITDVPLSRVLGKVRQIPKNSDVIEAARSLGVSFGDE